MSENSSTGSFGSVLSDGLVVALLTALSYYFAFEFQETYIGEFGFGPSFVEVDHVTVIKSFAAFLGLLASPYLIVSGVPTQSVGHVLRAIFYFGAPLFLLLLAYWFWSYSGFTWLTTVFALLGLAIGLTIAFKTVLEMIRGKKFADLVFEDMQAEARVRSSFFGATLIDKVIDQIGVLPFAVIWSALFAGPPLGHYSAHRTSPRDLIQFEDELGVVVQKFEEGFLIATVVITDTDPDTIVSTNRAFYWEVSSLASGVELRSERLKFLSAAQANRERASLSEFLNGLSFLWSGSPAFSSQGEVNREAIDRLAD